jgi:hypothetical protein
LRTTAYRKSTPRPHLAGSDKSRHSRYLSTYCREALHTGYQRSRCPVASEQRTWVRRPESRPYFTKPTLSRPPTLSAKRLGAQRPEFGW